MTQGVAQLGETCVNSRLPALQFSVKSTVSWQRTRGAVCVVQELRLMPVVPNSSCF